jgi:hypothetical protein
VSDGQPVLDGWVPLWERPAYRPNAPVHGYFLVADTGAGLATVLHLDADLDRSTMRQWIAGRFAAQLDGLSEGNADEEMSFAYLLVYDPLWERAPVDELGDPVIVSRGTQPSCPEEWGQRPFAELLQIAIQDLSGS